MCDNCLAARELLQSDSLPAVCPVCGAADPWVGPVVSTARFRPTEAGELPFSPFYLAAVSPSSGGSSSGEPDAA